MEKQLSVESSCANSFGALNRIYSFAIKFTGILLLFFITASYAFAQSGDHEVSGTVSEVSGEPLIGVNVSVQGTTTGTTTNMNGEYSLSVPDPDVVLIFSYIGFEQQVIPVEGRNTIDVVLYLDTTQLDDLVVVGYGTQRRSDITGSVGIVTNTELEQPTFNTLQSLRGKVAGVNIFTNSGSPTGSNRVVIRGVGTINASTNPLYVVDGVVMENIDYINPNDIQSIEVLKDASATAIYGARGANGVILVTTKKGRVGETQVEYHSNLRRNVMQSHFPMLNSEQFLYVVTQAWMNNSKFTNFPSWNMCPDGSILPEGEGDFTY